MSRFAKVAAFLGGVACTWTLPVAAQNWSLTIQSAFTSTVQPVRNTHRYMTQNGNNFFELQADQSVQASSQPELHLGLMASVRPGLAAVAKLGLQSYRSQIQTSRVSSGLLVQAEDYISPMIPLSFGLRWQPISAVAVEVLGAADLFGYGSQLTADAHLHLAKDHSLYVGLVRAQTQEYVNTTTADPANWRLFYSGYDAPFPSLHVHVGYRFALGLWPANSSEKTKMIRVF